MFFLLSKILDFLLQPIIWIILVLAAGLLTRNPVRKKRLLVIGFCLLLFFSNPFIINETWLAWEKPPVPVKEVPIYDAAIVLTGITLQDKSPHDRVYFEKGADRILHALMLYRKGRFGKIIISGGSGSIRQQQASEADELRNVLLQAGVPDSSIIVENKSRNTRENALFTAEILKTKPELQKLLLITSAFHMRRAAGCFEKAGLQPDLFPADYYSTDRLYTPDYLILPSEIALADWKRLIREMTGFVTYKLLGYC
ncbi:YdcF family protein [Adhaeribacter soli]|uniref:YdcF family protein n=1 Tax=Adhaeribacter soli TaxID=2607655 RepID=A0A5N1J5E0_9BACT|nr:YdcF family protein [Adhaeribacter soli]KAA9345910.1 YdcF family protein [Adhaeribacter soli]